MWGIPKDIWLMWFRLAAYPKPSAPLTLYRGATPAHARGMSWTLDREHAGWFAQRFENAIGVPLARGARFCPGHVYCATVEPAGILAVVDDLEPNGRKEHEIIIDPAHLPRPVRRWTP